MISDDLRILRWALSTTRAHVLRTTLEAIEPKARAEQPRRDKEWKPMIARSGPKAGRNEPSPCGSGKKYKRCQGAIEDDGGAGWQYQAAAARSLSMRLVIGVALATIACGRDASPPGPAPGPPVRTAAAPPVDASAAPPVDALAAEPVDAPAAPAEPPAPKDPAVRLAATAYMTCAVLASGAVACWGGGNAAPYRVAGWTDIASVSVSGDLLCGVHRSGRVECGAFKDSEIAGGRMRIATTALQGVTAARDVATFADAACVVERTGEVGCWLHGAAPSVQRAGVRGASAIVMGILTGAEYQYAGSFYGCALTGGRLACFEIRDARPLDTSNTPTGKRPLLRFGRARVSKITGLSPPLDQVGDYRLCAGSGAARRCVDLDPQLHYEEASLPRPDETIPPDRIKQLVRSYNHSCAIYTTGAVACWGENGDGQLGRNGDASAVPVLVGL